MVPDGLYYTDSIKIFNGNYHHSNSISVMLPEDLITNSEDCESIIETINKATGIAYRLPSRRELVATKSLSSMYVHEGKKGDHLLVLVADVLDGRPWPYFGKKNSTQST